MRKKETEGTVRCGQEGGEPSQTPHLISPRSVLPFYQPPLVTLLQGKAALCWCVLGCRVPGGREGAPTSWAPCRFEVPAPAGRVWQIPVPAVGEGAAEHRVCQCRAGSW